MFTLKSTLQVPGMCAYMKLIDQRHAFHDNAVLQGQFLWRRILQFRLCTNRVSWFK